MEIAFITHIQVFRHYDLLCEQRLRDDNSLPEFVFRDEDKNTLEKGMVYTEQRNYCKLNKN